MQCPSCKSGSLKPTRIDDSLPALACGECEGALISLLYYRDWAERNRAALDEPADTTLAVAENGERDSSAALNCPKCSRFMTKYKVSGCSANRLDLCGGCDEAWLDGGEWELLKALQLSGSLPSIFTDAWQRKVRKQVSEIKLRERFAAILGEDIDKAEAFRDWLKDHPQRAEILFYLNQS